MSEQPKQAKPGNAAKIRRPANHQSGKGPSVHHAAHRVLVVGIDGVRLDVLNRLPTPHLDALAAEGFLAPIEVDADTPTMSGPCWATVVTGVTVAKHGVWSNDFTGNRLDVFPDFATRLAVQDGRRTFVAAGWQPLMQAHHGGPLFRAPSRAAYVSPTADTPEAWEHCDEQITEASVRVLAGAGAGAEAGAAGETTMTSWRRSSTSAHPTRQRTSWAAARRTRPRSAAPTRASAG